MAVPQPQIQRFSVVENPGQPDESREQTFEARLLAEVQRRYDLQKLTRSRLHFLWLVAALFAKGIHYIWYDHRTGVIEEWSQKKVSQCMYTPIPLVYYAVENLAAQYTNSNPKIVPSPTDADDPKMKAVMRSLGSYADFLDFTFYRANPHLRQTEAKMIPLRGVYTFLEWDKTGGSKIQLPQYEQAQTMICADCGYEVPNDLGIDNTGGGAGLPDIAALGGALNGDAQLSGGPSSACPHCGSTNIQPSTGIVDQGMVEARQGCVKKHIVDPFQVEVDGRGHGIEDSEHLIYDDIQYKSRLRRDYPWLKGITGQATLGNTQDGFLGLHYLLQLQTIVSNTGRLDQSQPDYMEGLGSAVFSAGYTGSFLNDLLGWRRRAWLDPEVYADWTTDETRATQLPGDNRLLPPKTPVAPMFPNGLLIHIINGNAVVKLENQSKNTAWNYCGYRPPAEGLHGCGVNPLVSLNRGYDEAHSFEMQALLMAALGIIVADERIKNVRNVPGSVVTLPLSARLPGESINSMFGRVDLGGAQAIATAEPVKEGIRGHIGDLSMAANPQGYGNRPQGVGEGTATAVRYNAGATNTLTQPPMELYAANKAQVIQKAVQMERIYAIRPKLYGKFGQTTAKWFHPMRIPEDVQFGPQEGTWRPRTLESEREDVANGVQILGIAATIEDTTVVDKAKRVFGFDDSVSDYEDWVVRGEKRLDALKANVPLIAEEQAVLASELMQLPPEEAEQMQMAQQAGMMPTPEQMMAQRLIELAEAAPRPLDLEGHVHLARFWLEVYNSDEFDDFEPVLQDAVEELYIMSMDGIGQAGAVQTDQMMKAQEPAMRVQEQQMAKQAQQEQAGNIEGLAAEDEKSENEHRREMEGKKFDSREADKNRRHEKSQSERDHKHTIRETKEKTRGAIAVSKAKPKPKPGGKRR